MLCNIPEDRRFHVNIGWHLQVRRR